MIGVKFMTEKLKFDFKRYLIAIMTLISICLLIAEPEISMKGVKRGLLICTNQIVPALFPFCVISTFLVNSDIINVFAKAFAPFMKLFNLPDVCAGAVLLSFTGGYPVGAITANSMYEKGEITKDEYKRLLLFCVNAGPAFVIGAVGNAILKSVKAGMILFLSLTLSGIITGILSGYTAQGEEIKENKKQKSIYNLSEAFVKSVSCASNTIINVCAWIVLFSCALEFADSLK